MDSDFHHSIPNSLFEKDIPEEEFGRIEVAVRMIRGVLEVERAISASTEWMSYQQAHYEIERAVYAALRKLREPSERSRS